MKGDRVEIVVDIGDGTKTYEILASKAGRRVEVVNSAARSRFPKLRAPESSSEAADSWQHES